VTIAHMGIYDYLSQLNERIKYVKAENARQEKMARESEMRR
jgi:lipid II:glycine glycyltransferase (peptidoglycan interpeptide bridge formation enzyme)